MQLVSTSSSAARRQLVHAAATLGAGNSVFCNFVVEKSILRFLLWRCFLILKEHVFLEFVFDFCFIFGDVNAYVGIVLFPENSLECSFFQGLFWVGYVSYSLAFFGRQQCGIGSSTGLFEYF